MGSLHILSPVPPANHCLRSPPRQEVGGDSKWRELISNSQQLLAYVDGQTTTWHPATHNLTPIWYNTSKVARHPHPKTAATEQTHLPFLQTRDLQVWKQLGYLHCSPSDIAHAIGEVSDASAAGPDRFPNILLRQCRSVLSTPLYLIWRKSLDSGKIAQVLKTANIVPMHKRGQPRRPIALILHLIKIFEKVLRNCKVTCMETHGLFSPSRHGFRLGRSCLCQLIAHYGTKVELLANGHNVDIYIDCQSIWQSEFRFDSEKNQWAGNHRENWILDPQFPDQSVPDCVSQ